jgi:hypothetical protein
MLAEHFYYNRRDGYPANLPQLFFKPIIEKVNLGGEKLYTQYTRFGMVDRATIRCHNARKELEEYLLQHGYKQRTIHTSSFTKNGVIVTFGMMYSRIENLFRSIEFEEEQNSHWAYRPDKYWKDERILNVDLTAQFIENIVALYPRFPELVEIITLNSQRLQKILPMQGVVLKNLLKKYKISFAELSLHQQFFVVTFKSCRGTGNLSFLISAFSTEDEMKNTVDRAIEEFNIVNNFKALEGKFIDNIKNIYKKNVWETLCTTTRIEETV